MIFLLRKRLLLSRWFHNLWRFSINISTMVTERKQVSGVLCKWEPKNVSVTELKTLFCRPTGERFCWVNRFYDGRLG